MTLTLTRKNWAHRVKLIKFTKKTKNKKYTIPRITTRGYYSLETGKKLSNRLYYLFPKKSFKGLCNKKELVIMIHGLRNDKAGAVKKFLIAKQRLRRLGYRHPVIGFSYDSNTKGAHIKKTELRALRVGQLIAQKNGKNLTQFVRDFARYSPKTKIRLMGHSLGAQVILNAVEDLGKRNFNDGQIESIHLFGASITQQDLTLHRYGNWLEKTVRSRIINYYAPSDEVLRYAHQQGQISYPLGLLGASPKTRIPARYIQRKVKPKNHRFASYAAVLKSFP